MCVCEGKKKTEQRRSIKHGKDECVIAGSNVKRRRRRKKIEWNDGGDLWQFIFSLFLPFLCSHKAQRKWLWWRQQSESVLFQMLYSNCSYDSIFSYFFWVSSPLRDKIQAQGFLLNCEGASLISWQQKTREMSKVFLCEMMEWFSEIKNCLQPPIITHAKCFTFSIMITADAVCLH